LEGWGGRVPGFAPFFSPCQKQKTNISLFLPFFSLLLFFLFFFFFFLDLIGFSTPPKKTPCFLIWFFSLGGNRFPPPPYLFGQPQPGGGGSPTRDGGFLGWMCFVFLKQNKNTPMDKGGFKFFALPPRKKQKNKGFSLFHTTPPAVFYFPVLFRQTTPKCSFFGLVDFRVLVGAEPGCPPKTKTSWVARGAVVPWWLWLWGVRGGPWGFSFRGGVTTQGPTSCSGFHCVGLMGFTPTSCRGGGLGGVWVWKPPGGPKHPPGVF